MLAILWAPISCTSDALGPGGAKVASVAITPATPVLNVGAQLPLVATVKDAQGNTVPSPQLFWSSSDTTVAVVSDAGIVTAVSLGSARIVASAEGTPGSATVTVAPIPVSTLAIAPQSAITTTGSSVQLQALAYGPDGQLLSGRKVSWSSSNREVATVDDSGRVNAMTTGKATITATSEGKRASATVTVQHAPVSNLSISPSTAEITVGQTVHLDATVRDSHGTVVTGQSVTWSSNNNSVATVSGSGVVTGKDKGSAVITAAAGGHSAKATVTVTKKETDTGNTNAVATVLVSPSKATMTTGSSLQFTATALDADGKPVDGVSFTWSSTNHSVATVSSNGRVTAVAAGTVGIVAETGGKGTQVLVTVTASSQDHPSVHSVEVTPASATMTVRHTLQLHATVRDAQNTVIDHATVTWSSSNAQKALVDTSGAVVALAPGTVQITATSGGKSGSATISIRNSSVSQVKVAVGASQLDVGETTHATATLYDATGVILQDLPVAWTSQNPAVAIVSSSGMVKGAAPGSAQIVATTGAVQGAASVTVQDTTSGDDTPASGGDSGDGGSSSGGNGKHDHPSHPPHKPPQKGGKHPPG
ncbi:MAG TPA: Ig-like domain-containing protein [Gemmatimonadaceae bacterium]|nr:Ig-like domain-containing protein [Gemmatimonadaceae bacterium]